MSDIDPSYKAYSARRALRMRRQTLDCLCPNDRDVYSHILCDRLACQQHADDEHVCAEFGGVKSSIEEESEPAEAAPPAVAWTTNHDPRSIGCRNCGSWLPQRVALCGPCGELPPCAATRWAAVWDGTAVCFLPVGHSRAHESVEGRTWTDRVYAVPAAESPVEALRSITAEATHCPRGCGYYTHVGGLMRLHEVACAASLVDESLDPAPVVDLSWITTEFIGGPPRWWRRLFPGRSTR